MQNNQTAVVFGAGKIARGFIAHLLTLSGYRITFVEKSTHVVQLLRERGKYGVHVMGAPAKDMTVSGFDILCLEDVNDIASRVSKSGVVFVSIGGPNLPEIAPILTDAVRLSVQNMRSTPINILLCENYFQPARWLRSMMSEHLTEEEGRWFAAQVGIVETMVLRSVIEPTPEMLQQDPLSLKVQDMWEMPADSAAFVGPPPPILGLSPKLNFQGGLMRKLFTYNATNAVIAYAGHLKGHTMLSDAANDPELLVLARAANEEASRALCEKFGYPADEQRQFGEAAIAKYQKVEIVDPIERNARDPIRKLGRNDRLVGPAALALEYGIRPVALCAGIGAAFCYSNESDKSAQKMQAMISRQGIRSTIEEVCGLEIDGGLTSIIVEAYRKWTNPCGF